MVFSIPGIFHASNRAEVEQYLILRLTAYDAPLITSKALDFSNSEKDNVKQQVLVVLNL